MKTLEEIQDYFTEVLEELEELEEREKMRFLIDLAEDMVEMNERDRTEDKKVLGCVSDVYVSGELGDEGMLVWDVYSGSLLVKGFLAILKDVFDEVSPEVFLEAEDILVEFVENSNLAVSLVPSRANALGNIYLKMKERAEELV